MGSTGKSSGCAICGAPVAPRQGNPAFPFCSERCQTIDLGNWLGESYRIPTQESPDEHATEDDSSDPPSN
jgi:uncharacterized protein